MEELASIVIDNGSLFCRAGFAGDHAPRCVFPSVVGRPRVGSKYEKSFVGDEAQSKRSILALNCPLERGIVTNWDDMERLWHHTFYSELHVPPEEHSVLLTETILNPKPHRAKAAQIMFETFNIPALYMANQPALALYNSGRTTGAVLDCGESVCQIVPVYEGFAVPTPSDASTWRQPFGGRDLTLLLVRMLTKRGYVGLNTTAEHETVRSIKERLCRVALDYEQETAITTADSPPEQVYELPDGRSVALGSDVFRCPEALFRPDLFEMAAHDGVHEALLKVINACDKAIHHDLFSNIVLAGGTSMFPGFAARIKSEVSILAPASAVVRVLPASASPQLPAAAASSASAASASASAAISDAELRRSPAAGRYAAWLGGSVLAALSSFQQLLVSKSEYDEIGSPIVHRKCF